MRLRTATTASGPGADGCSVGFKGGILGSPMPEPEDDDLLAAAARGDRDAFGLLVERHQSTVIRFVARFLGNAGPETAEDLAQDVFLGAWKAAPSFEPRAKVLTWLLRIAANTCLNHRRSRRLRRTVSLHPGGITEPSALPSAAAAAPSTGDEAAARVWSALVDLPQAQRAAIVLRHFHDLSYADIADVLETSVSAVESLLFRARKSLRGILTARNLESPQVSPELGAESL